jgi:hypothetical protein
MQLGPSCGVIVGVRGNRRGDAMVFEGQLVCKFGSAWHPVFLKSPPPAITGVSE